MEKKLEKTIKLIFIFCMMISQFVSPIITLAEEIIPVISEIDYNLTAAFNDNYEISLISEGANYKNTSIYLVETKVSFEATDSKALGNKNYYEVYYGNEINSGIIIEVAEQLTDGKYEVAYQVYDITNLDVSKVTDYSSFISTNNLVAITTDTITKNFTTNSETESTELTNEETNSESSETDPSTEETTEEQPIISPEITITPNENVIVTKDGTYEITTSQEDKNVEITASDNAELESSYYNIYINNEIILEKTSTTTLNFNNLLQGDYELEFVLYNSENEEIARKSIVITYGDYTANNLEEYFSIDENTTLEDINYMGLSTSILETEEEKELYSIRNLFNTYLTENNNLEMQFDIENNLVKGLYGSLNETDSLTISELETELNSILGTDVEYIIKDIEGNELSQEQSENTIIISTGMNITISYMGEEFNYQIACYGDVDGDYVTLKDIQSLIDYTLEYQPIDELSLAAGNINNDEVLDVQDITEIVAAIRDNNFTTKDNSKELSDTYTLSLINETFIQLNDKFTIYIDASGFDQDYINGIEANLVYDKEILKLASINSYNFEDDGLGGLNFETGKLLYTTTSKINADGSLLSLTFETVKAGNTDITINNIKLASDGTLAELTSDSLVTKITVLSEEENNGVGNGDEVTDDENTSEEESTTNTTTEVTTPPTRYYGNSYLQKLVIAGYDIEFSKYIYEYSINVGSDINSLDISALLDDASSTYAVYGNSDFVAGENIVELVVTASDGTKRTYTIKVNKEADQTVSEDQTEDQEQNEDQNKVEENNNVVKTIVIILIILVIIGLLYLIFKDDEEEQTENKKNNKNKK